MPTYSIPQAQWRTLLDTFSLTHNGWPVSIEIRSPIVGAQPEVLELPLTGISVSAPGDDPAVAVRMSRQEPEHITHLVEHVRRIAVDREGSEDRALEVDSADGTRTVLRFTRPPAGHLPA